MPLDDVLSLMGLRIALPLDDIAGEDDILEVEDTQVVIVQLAGCLEGNDVLAGSDLVPKPPIAPPEWAPAQQAVEPRAPLG